MKEKLIYYYNLQSDLTIYETEEYSTFLLNEKKYFFVPFIRNEKEIPDLLRMTSEIIAHQIPTGKFIYTKEGSLLVDYNDKKYVLLEFPMDSLKEYNVLDMIHLNDKLIVQDSNTILYRNNWGALWASKIDYFEYQVAEMGMDRSVILNSFSYYVGLAENAISYVNNTIKSHPPVNEKLTLQRKRIAFPNIQINYCNPMNYIIDIEVRDIASYFKSLFFNSYEDLFIEVNAYFKARRLSVYGYQLLFARLLFPSYYFDVYEKVMEGKLEEKKLLKIIEKVDEYEFFLKDMFSIISKYAMIEPVDWLIKKEKL